MIGAIIFVEQYQITKRNNFMETYIKENICSGVNIYSLFNTNGDSWSMLT